MVNVCKSLSTQSLHITNGILQLLDESAAEIKFNQARTLFNFFSQNIWKWLSLLSFGMLIYQNAVYNAANKNAINSFRPSDAYMRR